jgi:hypothetical protein
MTGLPFASPDECPLASDDGGSPVGVETAVPAAEHRLALSAARVPVSDARTGLGRGAVGGNGGRAEFGGFTPSVLAVGVTILASVTAFCGFPGGEAWLQQSSGLRTIVRFMGTRNWCPLIARLVVQMLTVFWCSIGAGTTGVPTTWVGPITLAVA